MLKQDVNISKAILNSFSKAYEEGVYSNTPTNRKLGRVGQKYGYEVKVPQEYEEKQDFIQLTKQDIEQTIKDLEEENEELLGDDDRDELDRDVLMTLSENEGRIDILTFCKENGIISKFKEKTQASINKIYKNTKAQDEDELDRDELDAVSFYEGQISGYKIFEDLLKENEREKESDKDFSDEYIKINIKDNENEFKSLNKIDLGTIKEKINKYMTFSYIGFKGQRGSVKIKLTLDRQSNRNSVNYRIEFPQNGIQSTLKLKDSLWNRVSYDIAMYYYKRGEKNGWFK